MMRGKCGRVSSLCSGLGGHGAQHGMPLERQQVVYGAAVLRWHLMVRPRQLVWLLVFAWWPLKVDLHTTLSLLFACQGGVLGHLRWVR